MAINALLMGVWRRQPQGPIIVDSDQGSQFSSYDNAVAESFFQLLKRERIRRKGLQYSIKRVPGRVLDYLKCFTTQGAVTAITIGSVENEK